MMTLSRVPLLLVAVGLAAFTRHGAAPAPSDTRAAPAVAAATTEFGALIQRLSEKGGFFDSDNLISNETSYQHVLGRMRERGVRGGAYVGVGPDQNFTYIAHVRPEIAFIIDIRRDNLLHHLMLKSLFDLSRNRLEYLCLLFGRPVPEDLQRWDTRSIEELVEYIDATPPSEAEFEAAVRRVRTTIVPYGYPLEPGDFDTLRRFHFAFFNAGLDLRFTSRGRPARSYYPTYRDLLLETDLEGRPGNYLVTEESFRFIKDLQQRHRIVPVVGDLAGPHALEAIGREVERRALHISAFYTSNVEYYLMVDRIFDRFAATVTGLPHRPESVIIRSYFSRGRPHIQNRPGYYATQLLEPFETFVRETRNGGYLSYEMLVNKNIVGGIGGM